MKTWRLICSGHLPPVENMAVDMALIDIYESTGQPIFRIYGWMPFGFSLGYFQKPHEVLDLGLCVRDCIPFVRRLTGGGIIFHGKEVTYSLVCSEKDIGSPSTVKDGYKTICSFLLESYRRLGLNPCFAINSGFGRKAKSSFCFAAFEDYDILIEGKKIGGNAQKRIKRVIFQHGSIPLEHNFSKALKYVREPVSMTCEKNTSLAQALGRQAEFDEFALIMQESFRSVFGVGFQEKKLTEKEKTIASKYEKTLAKKDIAFSSDRNKKNTAQV